MNSIELTSSVRISTQVWMGHLCWFPQLQFAVCQVMMSDNPTPLCSNTNNKIDGDQS